MGRDTQAAFPLVLAGMIADDFTLGFRADGVPHAPVTTIESGGGACRDLAVLFVECCRAMGLAAQFVSGYVLLDTPESEEPPDLHTWGEVYLRGGGWRGYDPSHGLAVADRHVVVAAAAYPVDAAPVTGTYRGKDVGVTLETQVQLTPSA